MARVLQKLLTNQRPLFLNNIAKLERATGGAGIDVRLIGEITQNAFSILRQIGFDPAQTSGYELYRGLLNLATDQSQNKYLQKDSFLLIDLGDGPISLNLRDVQLNAQQNRAYTDRSVAFAQSFLRAEIVRRYAEHERTHADFVHQLARESGLIDKNDAFLPKNDQENPIRRPKLLIIGDTFSDVFINLNSKNSQVTGNDEQKLIIDFGQKITFDGFETLDAVGPAANIAIGAQKLGLNASLLTFLGNDQAGKKTLHYLQSQNIDTSLVDSSGKKTNTYFVLRRQAERTILVHNQVFDYNFRAPKIVPDWIFLTQIDQKAWDLQQELLAYLAQNQAIKLAFAPGTAHFDWGQQKLAAILERTHILFLNKQEAQRLADSKSNSIKQLTIELHKFGPQIVVITDGANGAFASYDYKLLKVPNFPDQASVVDRTGAGDAFAATIMAGLAGGDSMDNALLKAPINSMSVVSKIGAQAGLLNSAQIEEYLTKAPKWYKLTEEK